MTRSKLLSMLVAFVFAVGMWVFVINNVTTEDSIWISNIPVSFDNEDGLFSDRNLVLAEGRDVTVDLQITGNRTDLSNLNNTNITISADLSQVTGAGEWRLPYTIEYPENVSRSNISVNNRSSYYINVTVDKLYTKEVEIQAVFEGNVAEGYTQETIELEYETLEVSGPQDKVSLVDHAQVVLERTNLSKTVSDNLTFTLLDAEGNELDQTELRCTVDGVEVEKIGVLMPVNMIKEVPLRVELIEGGGATQDHATVDIKPSTITIEGDPATLQGLNSVYLGTVDLSSIQTSVTEEFSIVIADGLKNLTGTTATVTVELKNLKTKTFQVTNLEYTNAPDGLSARLGTVSLEVQLRGPEDSINKLTAGSIRAVADLSGINATGQFSVPAEIYVDGASDVGAVGYYSVLVTISVPVEESTAVEVEASPEASAAASTDASGATGTDVEVVAPTSNVTEGDE